MYLLNITKLFNYNIFVGVSKKNWNLNMSMFILGIRFDIFIINLKYTIFLFKKTLKFLKNIMFLHKYIIILIPSFCNKINSKNGLRLYSNFLIKRNIFLNIITLWEFGLLTNYKIVNKQRKLYKLKRFPNLAIMLHKDLYSDIIKEASDLNILTLGIVDSDQYPLSFDYFIPGSLNSKESIEFYYRFFLLYFFIFSLKKKYLFYNKFILLKKKYKINE